MSRVQLLQIFVPWSSGRDLVAPLAMLTAYNEQYIRAHPDTPHLYKSGVRYQREGKYKRGRQKEKWLTLPMLYMVRVGDCEDLACALAGFYRAQGIKATAVAVESSIGFHIVTQLPDGRTEDPSRVLGMGADKDG